VTVVLHRALYFLRRAADGMSRRPHVALVAAATIFVAALVTGVFAAALNGAGRLLSRWSGGVQISVYLDPQGDLEAARAAVVAAVPGREVEAVSAAEALRRFRESLGSQGALLDGIKPGVLPPSIEVRAPGIRLAEAKAIAARLEALPGARQVDFGAGWLEQLERLLARLRWVGLGLLAALAGGAAVLVSNTLQLGVFARRDEIEIMKLVGATDGYVRAPFLLEGALQGLLGAGVAVAAVLAAQHWLLPYATQAFAFATGVSAPHLMVRHTAAILAAGGLVGFAGSWIAVARFLKT
jgi:cell division transport system permease protein